MFLSAGSDGQLYLYNGLDGSDILTLIDPALSPPAAHQGTIFSAIFSKDSNSIVTSSADRTTKLWNKEGKLLREWKFGTAGVDSMQIGNTWIGGKIISLSFSGDRNILNPEKDGIESILHGRAFTFRLSSLIDIDSFVDQFAVTSLVAGTAGTFISGDASGAMLNWKNGVSSKILGTGHSNLVIDIVKTGEKTLSIGMDDSVILIDSTSFSFVLASLIALDTLMWFQSEPPTKLILCQKD